MNNLGRIARTALRSLLWLLLAVIAIRGVATIVAPPKAATVASSSSAPVVDPQADAVRAFAVLFSQEYLTWRFTDPADHALRLHPYLRSGLDEQAGWSPGTRDQAVLGAWVSGYQILPDSRRLVTVAVRTSVVGLAKPLSGSDQLVYLAVPVSVSPQGLSVYDYPTFVPGVSRADPEGSLYGDEMTEPPAEIRALAEGFLRAYVGGSPAEAAYFMLPGSKPAVLRGSLHWQSLAEVKVYRNRGETLAVAEAVLQEPNTTATIRQRWLLYLEKRERWYVKDLLQKGVVTP